MIFMSYPNSKHRPTKSIENNLKCNCDLILLRSSGLLVKAARFRCTDSVGSNSEELNDITVAGSTGNFKVV